MTAVKSNTKPPLYIEHKLCLSFHPLHVQYWKSPRLPFEKVSHFAVSVCQAFECRDSLFVLPQRAALARTWQTWATACETGSSSFMETRSTTTLASSALARLQVGRSQCSFILSTLTTQLSLQRQCSVNRKMNISNSAGQEPGSQLQGLHWLDVLEAGYQQ